MASSSKQGPVPPVSPPGSAHHWEGDGTLHSYCYDYMRKRGWTETAAAFAADAGIDENEWKGPPIEAPQGLLFEWWSVFWDVFIARSQKTGHRNVMADTYVEAMRSKREPQIVQFVGMPGTPPIALPRSLAHPARTASASGPPHPSTPNSALPPPGTPSGQRLSYSAVPGQMLALQQQQQLQEQLQGRGMPPPGLGGRPVPLQQQPYHVQSQPQGPGPPPPQSPVPQGPAYPPNPTLQQHTLQSYAGQPQPPQPQPSQPSSNQSSPHVFHAPHPYANGAGGANGAVNGRLGPGPGQPSPVPMSQPLLQAMAAIGLSGRDPASLTPDEEVAVQNQMRRLGVMPATPAQQQYYRSQQQAQAQAQAQVQQQQQLQHQQQHQHQQHQQQQMQIQQQQQQQLGIQRPPLARVHSDQQRVGSGQFPSGGQQQHLHERQLMQQQMLQQQVQLQQQGIRQEPRDPRELQQRHQQMAYASSQVGSPSSPAYSAGASPYATPLQLHMLPPQSTAGAVVSPATAGKGRGAGIVASKASPAPPKRAGVEDPSPRGRKRARGSIKDEEQQAGVGTGPKTPRFEMDGSGPPSPALSIGALPGVGGPQFTVPSGQPYRPARSPSLGYDSATRGALDAIQIGTSTGRILGHQQHQLGHDDSLNGDVSVHGSLVGNGSISRPGSSASNYLIASNSYINPPDVASPNASNLSSRPPSVAGNPADLYSSSTPLSSHPPLHISIPSPLPPGAFSLGVPVSDATPGGSRPFAGAHPLISTPAPGESNGVTPQPGNPTDGFQYMAGGGGSGSGGNDLFADLSGLDFSLDSFIDHDLFNDKDEHLEVSLV